MYRKRPATSGCREGSARRSGCRPALDGSSKVSLPGLPHTEQLNVNDARVQTVEPGTHADKPPTGFADHEHAPHDGPQLPEGVQLVWVGTSQRPLRASGSRARRF